jgi:N-acetylglucosaminyldiphosphoundecaprenol N-acetyl-beta-D-mannosaminyltransferase
MTGLDAVPSTAENSDRLVCRAVEPEQVSTYDVCGVSIAAVPPDQAAHLLARRAASGGPFEVHLCNAYTLSLVRNDRALLEALRSADLNLADGTPVAWFGRKQDVHGPVRGPALMPEVVRAGVPLGIRHYLFGGDDGVAPAVANELAGLVQGVRLVGCETPLYRDLDAREIEQLADRIRTARAQIVWIGTGTPRQDHLVHRLAPLVDCAVVPVGAAFSYLAGRAREAPTALHGSGLEWIYRFASEPRRLWRRYLFGNLRFIVNVSRSRAAG